MRLQGFSVFILAYFLISISIFSQFISGSDITAFALRPMHLAEISYPLGVVGNCTNADVLLSVDLKPNGQVETVRVISCSVPDRGFDSAAVSAIQKSVFLPQYFYADTSSFTDLPYKVQFRCYDGFLVTAGSYAYCDPMVDSSLIPDLVKHMPSAAKSWPGLLTLYPAVPYSSDNIIESDHWAVFQLDYTGKVNNTTILYSSTDDSLSKQIALRALNDYTLFVVPPWLGRQDSQYIRISIRKERPTPGDRFKLDKDSTFIDPKQIGRVKLQYPKQAKIKREQGSVGIMALVEPDGSVSEVTLNYSSGFRSLDSAAIQNAYKQRYEPSMRNKVPIRLWISYEVNYRLD